MKYRHALLASLLMALAANAEVLDADDTTLVLQFEDVVSVSPERAFELFTDDVGQWWNGDHTYSLDAGNLSLTQDCFCERWDGQVVRHMKVAQYRPGTLLRLQGGLGPLQSMPLQGVMDIQFLDDPEGTTVKWRYHVRGVGLAPFAGPVNAVIGEQFERFRAHVAQP